MRRVSIRTIIETWKACGQNYSATARQPWGYVRGQGIRRKSTAPKHPKRALQREDATRVRAWREATGYCREKPAALARQAGMSASASTIPRFLQREGLVRPPLRYRRPRFQKC